MTPNRVIIKKIGLQCEKMCYNLSEFTEEKLGYG